MWLSLDIKFLDQFLANGHETEKARSGQGSAKKCSSDSLTNLCLTVRSKELVYLLPGTAPNMVTERRHSSINFIGKRGRKKHFNSRAQAVVVTKWIPKNGTTPLLAQARSNFNIFFWSQIFCFSVAPL